MMFELWEDGEDAIAGRGYTFSTPTNIQDMIKRGILKPGVKKLWEVEADTWEEACTKYHEYMGWEPYKPMEE